MAAEESVAVEATSEPTASYNSTVSPPTPGSPASRTPSPSMSSNLCPLTDAYFTLPKSSPVTASPLISVRACTDVPGCVWYQPTGTISRTS